MVPKLFVWYNFEFEINSERNLASKLYISKKYQPTVLKIWIPICPSN